MKKKLLFVTTALWIGGIETALVNLLNHFDYEKYDVTLLILRAELDKLTQIHPKCRVLIADREKQYSFKTPYPHAKLYHLTEKSARPSALHRAMMWTIPLIRWVETRLFIRYVRKGMQGEHFDTAVIYSDAAAETAIRAIDADRFLMFYHHGAMRHVYHDRIAYKKCEHIIAVSENQAAALRKYVPAAADKVVCIHNLTDTAGIRSKAALTTAEAFDPSKFNIVSVGRVSHEKGMDFAVRACAKLVSDGYDNVRWWIVGGGPDMQEVYDAIAETHMEEHVITVGMQSNPYPYIRQADLYVQPSRFEGYPMTILEALVLGQPVVSTDNNGAREILKDGDTGLLCKVSPESIATAVERFISAPGDLARQREIVKKHDFDADNNFILQSLYALL